MKKIATLFTCLCTMSVYSQWTYTANYMANPGTNPGGLNTEADNISTGWVNIVLGPQSVNVWSPPLPMPFTFNFFGSPVTQLRASQNGVITFSEATNPVLPSNTNGNLPD